MKEQTYCKWILRWHSFWEGFRSGLNYGLIIVPGPLDCRRCNRAYTRGYWAGRYLGSDPHKGHGR